MGDPQVILAYIDGMPMYAHVGWGLGVWMALLGAILLLMRSRYAVHAFALSLIGAVVSFAAQYLGPLRSSGMHTASIRRAYCAKRRRGCRGDFARVTRARAIVAALPHLRREERQGGTLRLHCCQ